MLTKIADYYWIHIDSIIHFKGDEIILRTSDLTSQTIKISPQHRDALDKAILNYHGIGWKRCEATK